MDKSQHLLENEIEQIKARIESDPKAVFALAEQYGAKSAQISYLEGEIQCLIILSRCCWNQMDYRNGLKYIKQAHNKLNELDTDLCLPEILHMHALNYWGQAKYYSAQQFWINALEQSALVDEIDIQIECLIGLGNVWRITNEHLLAKSTHELAVTMANKARIGWLEGKARILLAWDLYLLNNYIEMLSVLDGAMDVLTESDDKTWLAEIWDFRGLALLGLERIDDAEQATSKAHELAVKHDLLWMKAHSYISRARLQLLKKNTEKATELLRLAERSANRFDNGELLSQICFQQSRVAEESGDFQAALFAFRKYRNHNAQMLREQTNRIGLDKARASKGQLEQRARKLINRLRAQHEYDPEHHFNQMVSETYWWERLVLFKTALKKASYSVITIQHDNPDFLEVCTELVHSMCNSRDLLSRLSSDRLGLLLAETDDSGEDIYHILAKMIELYPWHRKGIDGPLPQVCYQDILTFPFTLEQLEESQLREGQNGKFTQ